MNLPELCIRRPVMTTLLMATVVLLGFAGYRNLPVAALPRVDFPTIQVTAALPGASPETMASSVATVLERQFSTIAGIDSMTSTSSLGLTNIVLQFDLDRNIDGAALDTQSAISTVLRKLPIEMTTPPSFRKVNPADQPILYIALASPTLKLSDVNEYAETTIAPQISQISGIAQVLVYGVQKFAVRVELDPVAAAARGITSSDVLQSVAGVGSNTPVGTMSGSKRTLTIEAPTQPKDANSYKSVVVAWRNGQPVRLEQIARVRNGVENELVASWLNDTRAIVLAIQRQPDANTVEVIDRIKAMIPGLQAQIPPSVKVNIISDRSLSIRAAVHDVKETLLIAIGLVVLVIFLFLKSARATIIPSLALPVSLIGTFAAMSALGFSIDNMSLLALTLSVGFVVDDAIVMLENIVRYVEGGMKPFEAALKGSAEIGFTILSMTISLVAVFIPVLFMGGVVGRIFREFAVTITVTILFSGLVSLTLTPMLCARFLKPIDHDAKPGLISRISDGLVGGMAAFYRRTLDIVLRHQFVTLLITLVTIGVSVWLYIVVPKGFFPTEDTSFIFATTETAPDIGFGSMVEHQAQVAALVRQDKAVDYLMSSVGALGSSATLNNGRMFISLKPKGERKETIQQVIGRLRGAVSKVPGINVYFVPVQNITIGGRSSKAEFQYTLQSSDLDALVKTVPRVVDRVKQLKQIRDVNTDLLIGNPQLRVEV
ncbi:MAG: efflux RND transporter permease subunit, partial [Proteobacteria bacterium]|nr:efflux RND transporter permease subunit [Pseudomonadota bacterium]